MGQTTCFSVTNLTQVTEKYQEGELNVNNTIMRVKCRFCFIFILFIIFGWDVRSYALPWWFIRLGNGREAIAIK